MEEKREKIRILSEKDLDISYFRGPGKGGSAKNKTSSGVNIIHRESRASGRSSDSRSQHDNKRAAFERMLKDPKFKFWLARTLYEIKQGEKLEETIENELNDNSKTKYEIKIDGKWTETNKDYFNTEDGRREQT
jgi:protein subunit release factor B